MRRRTMFPPIRPSPTIPSCIASRPFGALPERPLDGLADHDKPAIDVPTEVHPERAPITLGEHFQVATRLSRLHYAERVLMPRNGDVRRVVASDLQEDARVRAALVGLARRVEE